MKWLAYLSSLIILIVLILILPFPNNLLLSIVITLISGVIIYLLFKSSFKNKWKALKSIAIIAVIYLLILLTYRYLINMLSAKIAVLQNVPATVVRGEELILTFAHINLWHIILPVVLFVVAPALVIYLESLVQKDVEGYVRSPWLVLFYVIISFGLYSIYWLWLIKQALKNSNIQTRTLWWLLFPVVGSTIVYVNFSKALETKTKISFWTWFLIFFFFNGLDVIINQTIINTNIKKQTQHPI